MFTITTTPEPSIDGIVIKMTGAATVDAGPKLQMKLTFAVASHPRNVVLDMSELEILTSLCIGELVSFRKATLAGRPGEHDGDGHPPGLVAIAGASELINKSLRFTRLDQLFPLYPDVASALAAIRG